jgi:hypothetical protein
VPSNLVEQQNGVRSWRDRRGDLGHVQVHRLRVQWGRTRAAPVPSLGQIGPKM